MSPSAGCVAAGLPSHLKPCNTVRNSSPHRPCTAIENKPSQITSAYTPGTRMSSSAGCVAAGLPAPLYPCNTVRNSSPCRPCTAIENKPSQRTNSYNPGTRMSPSAGCVAAGRPALSTHAILPAIRAHAALARRLRTNPPKSRAPITREGGCPHPPNALPLAFQPLSTHAIPPEIRARTALARRLKTNPPKERTPISREGGCPHPPNALPPAFLHISTHAIPPVIRAAPPVTAIENKPSQRTSAYNPGTRMSPSAGCVAACLPAPLKPSDTARNSSPRRPCTAIENKPSQITNAYIPGTRMSPSAGCVAAGIPAPLKPSDTAHNSSPCRPSRRLGTITLPKNELLYPGNADVPIRRMRCRWPSSPSQAKRYRP
jgi:hypothetical protein